MNINKIKLVLYDNLVDQAYSKFNETLINNQDPRNQIEHHETARAEYLNENDLEDINKQNFSNSQLYPQNVTTSS